MRRMYVNGRSCSGPLDLNGALFAGVNVTQIHESLIFRKNLKKLRTQIFMNLSYIDPFLCAKPLFLTKKKIHPSQPGFCA